MTEEQNEKKVRQLILAYKRVFGVEGERTKEQQIVWDDLNKRLKFESPVFMPNFEAAQGKSVTTYDPLTAALNDGMRWAFAQIKEFVEKDLDDKPKPTVKK